MYRHNTTDILSCVLTQFRHIIKRLDDIEERIIDLSDGITAPPADEDEEYLDELSSDEMDPEAVVDHFLDAADDIEERGSLPMSRHIAQQLREIARMIREGE